ncbi:MAG: hypothetical protein A3A94_02435 [Candidatus Portnoybacteria bacterium RIFCSPLOWO2_01_FULL_43_11]|uniref:DUF5615 domain-containing protein n=4 Tax=Candidatus Portnoyibacteriota TaxID=1817913 RepID=A0A1G2FCK5_9BACT|nr:MAG: hypothetical protein A2815_02410 [Candidatus Portnoybacteria bacterium RIFCSPHIGHO2_01_FULL_40_12b]OGZ37053.1 MAG: hypothetical protein A3D38_02140 [Candidatus Portnoybacteria bacterium RIFCSPHIGHO2_02_FULL_40_23]OGZ38869.1 MAG: hypothetical protein A3A94_02435 [Candidatus Portnoybacteria bacterium RIFCSPLOWO2_01_FULL_43_11]OGZ39457.1 MAG: hypothetical protein A3E90_01665 [Candidatus Portnoybacteria bacterium RIFCSPHIGHO2_12_FULL_40_11]OGZ40517.1 MAG: hypothetical protein A3I20_00520 [C
MKGFIADENIAPIVIKTLRDKGFDVLGIGENKFYAMNDEEILKLAEKQKRIIITHDKDFGNLIHQFHQKHRGVILLRLRDQSPQNVIRYLIPFLKKFKLKKLEDKLIIIREGVVKIL